MNFDHYPIDFASTAALVAELYHMLFHYMSLSQSARRLVAVPPKPSQRLTPPAPAPIVTGAPERHMTDTIPPRDFQFKAVIFSGTSQPLLHSIRARAGWLTFMSKLAITNA
jgi:hypothetical protein